MCCIRRFVNNDSLMSFNNVLQFTREYLIHLRAKIDGRLDERLCLEKRALDLHKHLHVPIHPRRRQEVKPSPSDDDKQQKNISAVHVQTASTL